MLSTRPDVPDAAPTRRAPSPWRWQLTVVATLLAFIAVTNRWMSFVAGYNLLQAHDESDFQAIAEAAPHRPVVALQEQHAQRFVFHYLIGCVAKALSANVDSAYFVAMGLAVIALCGLLTVVLRRIGVSRPIFVVCLGVFILNAYSLRYYGLAPAEIADLLFEIGSLLCILGCLSGRFWLICVGIVWATAARQSAVPMAFALSAWLLIDPSWRDAPASRRWLRALAVPVLSGAGYAVLVHVANPFSAHTTPGFTHFTLLSDLAHLPHGAGHLGDHFLRCANGLFSLGALLIAALWLRHSRAPTEAATECPSDRRSNATSRFPFAFRGCMLVAGSVILQAVVFSPQYAAHNETRLAILGLPALICALAYALRGVEHLLTPRRTAALLALLVLGSFHHLYTWLGTANASQTVVLQALVALALALVVLRAGRVAARPRIS